MISERAERSTILDGIDYLHCWVPIPAVPSICTAPCSKGPELPTEAPTAAAPSRAGSPSAVDISIEQQPGLERQGQKQVRYNLRRPFAWSRRSGRTDAASFFGASRQ